MRVKASAVGLRAEEYRAELAVDSGWTGMDALDLAEQQMADLWEHETVPLADVADRVRRAQPEPDDCSATPASCCTARAARRSAG